MHACVCVYIYMCVCACLGHDTEHRDVAADARPDLLVVLLGVCVCVCMYVYICMCVCVCARVRLGHDTEHRVVAADARPDLLVVLLGVAHLVKLRLQRNKQTQRHVFLTPCSVKVMTVISVLQFSSRRLGSKVARGLQMI